MIRRILLACLLVFGSATVAAAQGGNPALRTAPLSTTPEGFPTSTNVSATHQGLDVNIVGGGGSGGTASNFNAAFPATGTAVGARDPNGNMQPFTLDANGTGANLQVNCKVGCSAAGDTVVGTTALGAVDQFIAVALAGERGASFQLAAGGTGVYTVVADYSVDGGTTYFNPTGNAAGKAYFVDPVTGAVSTSQVIASGQAVTSYTVIAPSGASHLRVRVGTYTSGTANWTARSTVMTSPVIGAFGIVTTSAPSYTTGTINGLSLDTNGNLRTVSAGGGGLSVTDEAPWTAGSSQFTPSGGVFNDSAAALTSGQQGTYRLTNNRALHVNLRNAAGTEIGTSGTPIRTDPTGGTTQPVSGTVTANQGTSPWVDNISQWGGTNVLTGGTAGSVGIGGLSATGTTASGNPDMIGGVFNTTQPTVTNGQVVDLQATARGALIVATGVDAFTVAGTVTTTPPSNASTNVAQFGGVNISTGTGASGTGIPRVTVANDSNILATQSGTWTVSQGGAPWSQNVTQFGGVNLSTGTGVSGTGIPRVTISNDSSLAANQSVNVAQFGGTNTVTGTGASGAGIPRVTVSNDSVVALTTGSSTIGAVTGTAADNSADSTLKLPVLAGRANASAPSWTEGNQVPLSTDLNGGLRVIPGTGGSFGLSVTDQAAWTAGSSSFTPSGGEFNDSGASLASGTQGTSRLTANRALHENLRDSAGNEVGAQPYVNPRSLPQINQTAPTLPGNPKQAPLPPGPAPMVRINGTPAQTLDYAQVVALSPASPLPTGTNSLGTVGLNTGANVIGSVTQSGSWTFTASTNSLSDQYGRPLGQQVPTTGGNGAGGAMQVAFAPTGLQAGPTLAFNPVVNNANPKAQTSPFQTQIVSLLPQGPGIKNAQQPATVSDPALVVLESPTAAPVCATALGVSQAAAAGTLIANPGGFIHICSVILVSASAETFSLVEGTGTNCATGTGNLIGQYNAGAGTVSVAANGGFSAVSHRPWLRTQTRGDNLCLVASGTTNISGTITYTIGN